MAVRTCIVVVSVTSNVILSKMITYTSGLQLNNKPGIQTGRETTLKIKNIDRPKIRRKLWPNPEQSESCF